MKTILLIEDNDDIRNNMAEILELSNYKVVVAENGKVGVEKAIEAKPDLIICDIIMPLLDGYGVLHAVHRNEAIKNTPFIFLTAKTERSDFRKGMELGADDYITKPFNPTELLNAIESRIKKIELLKKELQPNLEGLRDLMQTSKGQDALQELTQVNEISRFKKKQIVYFAGNHPNKLYYVIKGKVKIYKNNEQGKELVTDLFSPGDFFGYVALLEDLPYQDTAEALEDTEVAVIPKKEFEELMNKDKEVASKFIRLLAKNISDKENQLLGLAYNSLRKKVAEALLLIQKKYNKKENESKFAIDINRENLSSIAGTAKESLIRTLSDFKNEKLIDIINGEISILDQKKLEHMLN
jgi:CRP-like cAMP-binding protein/ActR/RegA family two-component response regulator